MTDTSRYRIGFDIGGTFTDFILLDTERNEIRLHKCLTTPRDPSVGAAYFSAFQSRWRSSRGSRDRQRREPSPLLPSTTLN